jgi:hypothetical protein
MSACVSCDRLADALRPRSLDLWQQNPHLAERIELLIKADPSVSTLGEAGRTPKLASRRA